MLEFTRDFVIYLDANISKILTRFKDEFGRRIKLYLVSVFISILIYILLYLYVVCDFISTPARLRI